MKKLLFFILLFVSLSVRAQFIDTMGALSVQGALTAGATSSTARTLSLMKRTQIVQDIRMAAMEIKTQFMGNYDNLNSSNVSNGLFSNLNWSVGPENDNLFYIQLNQIDNVTCNFLLSQYTSASYLELNGERDHQGCRESNQIKFVFN